MRPTQESVTHPRHRPKVFYLFLVNIALACVWGPGFIILTLAGPTRHLSSTVVWVAIISYYANCMGNLATAGSLYASMIAHSARDALGRHEAQTTREGNPGNE